MTPLRFHIVHVVPDPGLHGLYGYREVIETLQWGLTALGHEATVAENAFADGRINVVLGFQMLGDAFLEAAPPETIVYNFEQLAGLEADALKPAYRIAARRLHVWDYSEHNLPSWERLQPAHGSSTFRSASLRSLREFRATRPRTSTSCSTASPASAGWRCSATSARPACAACSPAGCTEERATA